MQIIGESRDVVWGMIAMDDQVAVRFKTYMRAVEQAKRSVDREGSESSRTVLVTMVERLAGYMRSIPPRQLLFSEKDSLRCLTLLDGLAGDLPDRVHQDADFMVSVLLGGAMDAMADNCVLDESRMEDARLGGDSVNPDIATAPAVDPVPADPVPEGHGSAGRTILLIDSDPVLGKHVSNQLMQYGYYVSLMDGFGQVETLLETGSPDCIVSTSGIGTNPQAGPEFFAGLMARGVSLPPVIFLAEDATFLARLAALRAGGQAYIAKPYRASEVIAAVDTLVEKQPQLPKRFVIVDDAAGSLNPLASALELAGSQVSCCRSSDTILKVLSDYRPDILVLDSMMDGVSGIEIAKVVRQDNRYVSLPIVIMTDEGDIETQASGLIEGSDTFLIKSVAPAILAKVLQGQARRSRDIAGLLFHDSLTGLLNHSAIKDRLAGEMSRSGRMDDNVAFVLFDLDHFKHVNDTYGHPVGDQVLKNFSRLLSTRLRQSDSIGRYGGEEFAVVMPDTDAQTAFQVIDKLREAFAKVEHDSEQGSFSVTFSAGICTAFSGAGPEVMIKYADEAMYEAKDTGRNRVIVWNR